MVTSNSRRRDIDILLCLMHGLRQDDPLAILKAERTAAPASPGKKQIARRGRRAYLLISLNLSS